MVTMQYRPSTNLFGPVFNDFISPVRMPALARVPKADVMESEGAIRVMVELPGFRPEDIAIEVEGNVLTISGEKRQEWTQGEDETTWHLSERHFGRFTRAFILPQDVEQDRIEARCENGVLNVVIPKSERARLRRIEILGSSGNGQAHQQLASEASGRK